MLRVTSVEQDVDPGYPTRRVVDDHPELLQLVPKRWRTNQTVLAALTGVCLLMSGCRGSGTGKSAGASRVAPIFEHGEGRGSYGCVIVSPPAYLSEAEARQVIEQEAKKAGLSFEPQGKTFPAVRMPETDPWWYGHGKSAKSVVAGRGRRPLRLDGTDRLHNVSYEFVSRSDYVGWQRKGLRGVSVYGVDTLATAKVLRESLLRDKPEGRHVVFYDPVAARRNINYVRDRSGQIDYEAVSEARKVAEKEAEGKEREQLREQVRDFIKWLKAEGVI